MSTIQWNKHVTHQVDPYFHMSLFKHYWKDIQDVARVYPEDYFLEF